MSWIQDIARRKKGSALEAMCGKEFVTKNEKTVKEYKASLAALIMELPDQN